MSQSRTEVEVDKLTQEWMDKWADCVGAGWHKILKRGVSYLFLNGWDGCTTQIKEKFGTLRFYCTVGLEPEGLYSLVDAMEFASGFICERCGEAGKSVGYGWIKTACTPCAEKLKNKEW